MDYEDVRERLPSGVTVEAWEAIRPNLSTVAEAADWWQVVEGPVSAEIAAEDRAYLAEAARVLETLPFDSGVWQAMTGKLKEMTGRQGKALFLPLRLELTGREHRPELAARLTITGHDRPDQTTEQAHRYESGTPQPQ